MEIKIINKSNNPLPEYLTEGSSGVDLRANLPEGEFIEILPHERAIIPTGLFLELPVGIEAQIRPRSGLAIKKGITVLNSPGTIDSDYRGEIMVILINLSEYSFKIKNSDRIAQMVFSKYEKADFKLVDTLEETERGTGGFGHTGV